MKQLINILNMLIAIVKTPQETWRKLSGEYNEEQAVDLLIRDYYAPLMGGGALILFMAKGLQVPDVAFSWQHAIMGGVKFIIGFYGGLFLAEFLLKEVLRLFGLEFEKFTLRAFVVLAMSFCLGLDVVVNCLPGISFFYVMGIYLAYIVWCAAPDFMHLEPRDWWKFSLLASLIVYFSPHLIRSLLLIMESAGQ